MAVTSLKFLQPFKRPKNAKISKRSAGALAVLDFCYSFYYNTADYFKSILEVDLSKNTRNKIIIKISASLIIQVGLF